MLSEREIKVDSKRRPAIPADLLNEAGIGVGDRLIVTVAGPGNIVLRTRAAILAEVRAEINAGFENGVIGNTHAIDDIRAERKRESANTNARLDASAEPRDPAVVQQRGKDLLDRLGL